MTLPFGKYKDYEIEDVPSDYLEWLLEHDVLKSRYLREEAERVLDEREGGGWYAKQPPHTDNSAGTAISVPVARRKLFAELIECGFRALSLKKHPDHGGSNEAMRELVELRDALRLQLK